MIGQKGLLPIRLILVGIAVSAGFSAISLFFSLKLNDETYTFASRWLVGNVWGRDWIHVFCIITLDIHTNPLCVAKI